MAGDPPRRERGEAVDGQKAIWDERYERSSRSGRVFKGDPWLCDWLHLVSGEGGRRALDVGCGWGHNTRLLLDRGFTACAFDISEGALDLCRREAPGARLQCADVRDGLPFPGERFDLIVADLSLHYFPWGTTVAVVEDVASRLVSGGLFAGRFNSTDDVHFGVGTGEPVPGEENLLLVHGLTKRFFTRDCIRRLFGPPWETISVEEKTSDRYGRPKALWEVVARRPRARSNRARPGPRSPEFP
jgi:SAM-dependent methyltransferase